MNATKEFDAKQARAIAKREYCEHSYNHRRPDPDNCAACALRLDEPNYSGWPLVYIALGLPMNEKAFLAELEDAKNTNEPYAANIATHLQAFGHPGFKP